MPSSLIQTSVVVAIVTTSIGIYLAKHVKPPNGAAPAAIARPAPFVASAVAQPGTGFGRLEIAPDSFGGYYTDVEIYGHRMRMLVDTGASFLVLSSADADALGIHPAPAEFTIRTQTANGIGVAARTRLSQLQMGSLELHDVEALVMPADQLSHSLLGMSALKKLSGFEIINGKLVLRQ
jgi:aspartyl protease family protein